MPKKRASHEGTIYQLPSGSWRAQVTLQGQRLSHTAPTQDAARKWIQKVTGQIENGLTYQSTQTTLSEFLDTWIKTKEKKRAESTIENYKIYIRLHIKPRLGKLKLGELTPAHIQAFYNILVEEGVTIRPIQICHSVLHCSLNHAKRLGLVSSNPANAVEVPDEDEDEMKIWDESQVSQFLVSIQGSRNENLYRMAIALGMRRGELLGLKWSDISWERRTIRLVRQVVNPKGGGFKLKPPKTDFGRRTIKIGDNLIAKLREQYEMVNITRQIAGKQWKENDLVFPSTIGTPQQGSNLYREFSRLVDASGVEKIRFHDLRHTAASLMLNHGIPPIVVSRILGHSKVSITLDLYGHLIPEFQEGAVELMDEITTTIPVEVDL